MGNLNKLVFGDIDSGSYGVFISGEGAYNSPRRRGESVLIPGRNGALFFDEGAFENISVIYQAFVAAGNAHTFGLKMRELRSMFGSKKGYQRLEDTYHPDEFRLGIFREGVTTEPTTYNTAGRFNLEFDCKPQRFLVSGEQTFVFSENGILTNPTPFESSPIIRVVGNGTVAIGPYQFTVFGSTSTITIDSEVMEVYLAPSGQLYPLEEEGGEDILTELNVVIEVANGYLTPQNMTNYISFKNSLMPKIPPGEVRIGMTSGIEGLEIIPRWWVL